MAMERNAGAGRHLRVLFESGVVAGLSDRELIERFAEQSGEVSELAFAALVERHGPMVLQVCRATIGDEHEAHDAFQATFLLLVHKARSLWVHDSIGPWLHAVAVRIAAGARASSASRRSHECRGVVVASPAIVPTPLEVDELRAALHEEIDRLPQSYRKAVVLCDLEGLTHAEAARRLGWPIGTVKSRQARGRDRLRSRLIRRGLAPASGAFASMIASSGVQAAVPTAMVDATARVASMVAAGQTSAVAASAAAMASAIVRATVVARIRLAVGLAMALGTTLATAGLAIRSGAAPQAAPQAPAVAPIAPRRPALDALSRAGIPPEKRLADLPPPTVAVLGEVRGRAAGEVRGLAITPDGKTLATVADQDHMVRLWDAATRLPAVALTGHRGFGHCVAISPDGQWLASGGEISEFLLWDIRTMPPTGPTLLPTHGKGGAFNNILHAATFSTDGRVLAVSGDAGGFELFDMTSSPPASLGVLESDARARSLVFSPDGKTLAMAGLDDGSIRLVDVTAAPRERATLQMPEVEGVVGVRLAPRADGAPGPVVQQKMRSRTPLVSAAFFPDGRTLVALDRIGYLRRWDLTADPPTFRGKFPAKTDLPDNAFDIRERAMLAFSPDGKVLAAADLDARIKVWDRSGNDLIERAAFPAHTMRLAAGAFSPDGRTLYTGGGDQMIRAWDLSAVAPAEKDPPQGPVGAVNALAFRPDGTALATADFEWLGLWDLTDAEGLSRRLGPKARLCRSGLMPRPMAFRPDGKSLFWGGSILAVNDKEPGRNLLVGEPMLGSMVHSLALSADGQTLAAGGIDHKVQVWDVRTNDPTERLKLDGDAEWPPAVALSPDGVRLAYAGPGHSVHLWILAGLEPRERAAIAGNGWPISSLAFSPNGKILAAGTNNGTRVWDISTAVPQLLSAGKPIGRSYGISIAFTPDGKRLVAADQISDPAGLKASRPAVCVYDVATGDRLHAWEMTVPCWAIAMAPDGRHVAVARRDGLTLILRLPDDRQGARPGKPLGRFWGARAGPVLGIDPKNRSNFEPT